MASPEEAAANMNYVRHVEDAFEAFRVAHPGEKLLVVRVGCSVADGKGSMAYNGEAFVQVAEDGSIPESAATAVVSILAQEITDGA